MKDKPKFIPDSCPNCQYLGSDDTYDYYTCPQMGMRTYIARYGNEPWEYSSVPIDHVAGGWRNFPKDSPEAEAYRRYNKLRL